MGIPNDVSGRITSVRKDGDEYDMNPVLKDLIFFLQKMIFGNYATLRDDAGRFIIKRFEGEAFPGAYKCFYVESRQGEFNTGDGTILPEKFVVKVTDEQECKLLFLLKSRVSVCRECYIWFLEGYLSTALKC